MLASIMNSDSNPYVIIAILLCVIIMGLAHWLND